MFLWLKRENRIMNISQKHIKTIQARIDFLTKRIEDSSEQPRDFDKAERNALIAALQYIDDEQSNVHQNRAFSNGQKTLLKFYKKQLEKAVRTKNVETLQWLLDRTKEWLAEADEKEMKE